MTFMTFLSRNFSVVTVAAMVSLAAFQSRSQITFSTASGASVSGGAVDAQATFNLSGDVLTIELVNLQQFDANAGQLISGLTFNVSSGTGADLNSALGYIATSISGSGSYSPSSSQQNLSQWAASTSGSGSSFNVDLTALSGGKPNDLIIGPDSADGFSGAGTYDVNSSVIQHLPVVLGTATFTVTVGGLSSLKQISDVQFNFGTSGGEGTADATPNTPAPVPEPVTVISAALLLVPLSVQLIRKGLKRSEVVSS
jgi:hypothetical protein